jgi:Zn ribbon nucleic-acid-binding protein
VRFAGGGVDGDTLASSAEAGGAVDPLQAARRGRCMWSAEAKNEKAMSNVSTSRVRTGPPASSFGKGGGGVMSSREQLKEWAELNGQYGRCPRCRKQIWVESGCAVECHHCGYFDDGSEEDVDEDQEPDSDRTLGLCLGRD